MVWEDELPPPDIHFPSCDVGEKVRYFLLSVDKESMFIKVSLTSLTLLCILNGSLSFYMYFNSDKYLTLDILILDGGLKNREGKLWITRMFSYTRTLSNIALYVS